MEREKAQELKKLTNMQSDFLEALFTTADGNLRMAASIAGYSKTTKISLIITPLKEEIVDLAYLHLASNAPNAVLKMVGVLENPSKLGSKTLISAAKEILDRGGIVRTDKVELTVDKNAIFILPAKEIEEIEK